MRRFWFVRMTFCMSLFFLVFALSPVAMGQQKPPAQKGGQTAEQRIALNYITNTAGSGLYTISVGQAQIIGKKTNIEVAVQPAAGTSSIPRLVFSKEAMLGVTNANILGDAYRGKGGFADKTHPTIRALQSGQLTLFGIVTHAGTGIKTIPDLKGKKFTWNIVASEISRNVGFLEMKAYGLDGFKDVKGLKSESTVTAMRDLELGRTDAIACSLGGSKFQELAAKVTPVVLSFDPSRIGVLQKEVPSIFAAVSKMTGPIPAGIPVVGAPDVFFTHKDLDEEIAYRIVKTLLQSLEDLKPIHRDFSEWTAENAVKKLPIPYHPGAIKYYKEIGLWSAEMDQHQAQLLK